jgi:hypothetical protein
MFKAAGAPPPPDPVDYPNDWQGTVNYNFLAPGTANAGLMTCWSTPYGSTGKLRYQCNLTGGPPGGYATTWTQVDTGGAFHAWAADPGGATALTSCELTRTRDGGAPNPDGTVGPKFLAQYWGGGTCSVAEPGPVGYTDTWVATSTIFILP